MPERPRGDPSDRRGIVLLEHAQQRGHRARGLEPPDRRHGGFTHERRLIVEQALERAQRAAILDSSERPRRVRPHVHHRVAQLAHQRIDGLLRLGEPETDRRDGAERRVARRQLRDERRRDALVILMPDESHAHLAHARVVRRQRVQRARDVGVGQILHPTAIAALGTRGGAEWWRGHVGPPSPVAIAERLRGEAADDRRRTPRRCQQRRDIDCRRAGPGRCFAIGQPVRGRRGALAARGGDQRCRRQHSENSYHDHSSVRAHEDCHRAWG